MKRNEELSARERISRAIIQLLDKHPFYAELLMRSKIKELPESCKMRSMAVDMSGTIYYDEDFVASLDDSGLEFVLLHETLHKANLHLFRLKDRDADAWNIAADIVVNHDLIHDLRMVPPAKVSAIKPDVSDVKIEVGPYRIYVDKLSERSVEDVYVEVLRQLPLQRKGVAQSGSGSGQPNFDDHKYEVDGEGDGKETEQDVQNAEEKLKDEIIDAAFRAKKRGQLPSKFERLVDKLLRAKIDWRSVVYRHVTSEIPYDYTLSRPNRRFVSQGLYLPGVLKENLDVVAMVDTSGSISKKELNDFVGELQGIVKSHENVSIVLLVHDSEIKEVHTLSRDSDVSQIKYLGGGGTSHVGCFEWVDKNKPHSRIIVSFTDGFSEFPKDVPRAEVLWVLSGRQVNSDVPFGTVVRINE